MSPAECVGSSEHHREPVNQNSASAAHQLLIITSKDLFVTLENDLLYIIPKINGAKRSEMRDTAIELKKVQAHKPCL